MDKTISLALKGAAGVMAASMSMMGLAYAGVDLPGQAAERALEAVSGVELPNQGSDNGSVADDVKAVVDSDMEKGCEFGQAVAAAASKNAKADRPDEERCTESDEDESGAKGSKATGDEKSAEGRAKATEKSGGAADAGADNATTGTERASEGGDNASDADENATTGTDRATSGAGNAPTGDSTDTEEDEDGDSDGAGTGDEKSGGAATSGASNAGDRP